MITGLWTALPPLDRTQDQELGGALEYLLAHGVDGFFALGTTGRGADLTLIERQRFLERLIGLVGMPQKIVIAISANPPGDVRALMEHAFSLGVEGVAMTPPFYGAFDQNELIEWVHGVFDGIRKERSVYLYNMPAVGHTVWELDMVSLVDEMIGIDGIKDSSGDIGQVLQYLAWASGHNASVLVGNERLTTYHYLAGGHGVVSGLSAMYPRMMADLIGYCTRREWDQACSAQEQVNRQLENLVGRSLRAGAAALVQGMRVQGILRSH